MPRRLILASILYSLVASTAPLQAEEQNTHYLRQYEIRNLDLRVAEALAWDLCPTDSPEVVCKVEGATKSPMGQSLVMRAPAAVHRRLAAELAASDVAPSTHAFQIFLVEPHDAGGAEDQMPEGARAALEDLRAVLPYGGYRLIDTAWVRSGATQRSDVSLHGPGDRPFLVSLRYRDGGSEQLYFSDFQLVQIKTQVETADPETGEEIVVHYPQQQLISTSFDLRVGETVVVGTSRPYAGRSAKPRDPAETAKETEALIVLVTAQER